MAAVWIVVVVVLHLCAGVRCDIFVTTTVNPVGLVGNNELELVCTYSLASTDIVFTISWDRETSKDSGTFEQLALFYPPGQTQNPASLTNLTNPDVFGRVTLTNPTESSLTAKLKFTRVVCGDERKYQSMPDITTFGEVEVVPATNIVEGQTVQFTCTSNVGLPAGTFLWIKHRGVSDSVGSNVSSTTQTSPSTDCTYTGSSTINIAMTKDDDGVILRCTLQQDTISAPSNNMYYKQTDPIKVYYQTRQPIITRNPMKDVYYEGEDLTLTCAAEGNPAPTYIWRVNGTQVGTAAQLSLTNIQVDQSRYYACVAKNNFSGNTYSLVATIDITIERPPPTTPVTSVSNEPGISTTQASLDGISTTQTSSDGQTIEERPPPTTPVTSVPNEPGLSTTQASLDGISTTQTSSDGRTIEERPPPTTPVTSVPNEPGISTTQASLDGISTTQTASDGLNIEEATRMYIAGLVMVCVSLILMLATIGLGIFISRNKRLPCCTESKQEQPVRYLPGYRGETSTERAQYQQLDIKSVAGPSVYQTLGQTPDATDRNYDVLSGRSAPNVYQELSDVNAGKSRAYVNYALSKDKHNRKLK